MTRLKRTTCASAVLAMSAFLGACGDSTGLDGLDDTLVLDAAILAADATIEEVTMWGQPLGFGGVPVEGLARQLGGGVGRPGGHGTFDGEFSGTRSVTFFDEAGVEQDLYDRLTTESIHLVREIAGEIVRDNFSASISRERDMTVSGLAGEETTRTWNGSGSSETARSGVLDDGSQRSHEVSGTFTFTDVVMPIPGADVRYPLSGTIRRSMVVTRTTGDGTEMREVDITITFDGSAIAMAVINGESVEIDLSTRGGRNPLRRNPGG